MKDRYDQTRERLLEKLVSHSDEFDLKSVNFSMPFPYDQFVKANPMARDLVKEVEDEFDYEMSEHQCSWAVVVLIRRMTSDKGSRTHTWEIERIEKALADLTDKAFGKFMDKPIFSIPRKSTDADSILWDAIEELKSLREENKKLQDYLDNGIEIGPVLPQPVVKKAASGKRHIHLPPFELDLEDA